MIRLHVIRVRQCLLAAAVAQALIAVPAIAQSASTSQSAPASETAPDNQVAPLQSNAAKEKSRSPVTLQAVVVTAQRREQNLQEVPIAVSAIDLAELNARGITNIGDLNAAAPGLMSASEAGSALHTQTEIAIRGAFQGNPALPWDPPIGVYLNGVYIAKSDASMFNLPDLARIEVLRGPQGTLYGRNTLGGAINLITRPPSGVFGGTASVGVGNYNSAIGSLALDLPAMGKLKMSVGGRAEHRHGWVKPTADSPVQIRLGDEDDNSAFVALRFDATDKLSFDYRYDHSKFNGTPGFNQAVHSDLEQLFGIPGMVVNKTRQTRASNNIHALERTDNDINSLTVQWKMDDVNTFKYIAAHREMHLDYASELDGSAIDIAEVRNRNRYRQTSHEFQYLGSVGAWNWVAGLYYFKDTGFTYNPQRYFFGSTIFSPNTYGTGTRSRAAYGQVDYKLTDKLTVTGGLRRTIERKSISRSQTLNSIVIIPQGTAADAGFSQTTPTLSLSYQLNSNHMVYARYSKGFQSGGFNGEASTTIDVITPYLPESVKTFELGSKNTMWGGRARINADVFYNRFSELQMTVFTAKGAASSNIFNVGNSNTYGLELEAEVRATEDLSVHATYSYMNGKYNKFMELGVNVADNRAMAELPRHIASVVVNDTLLRTSKGVLRGTLDYRFTSAYNRYPYQIRLVDPTSPVAANTRVKSFGMLNGQLAFTDMAWGPRVNGEVALWVHNATNVARVRNHIDFGPGFGNMLLGVFNAPRSFGINVTAMW